MDLLPENEAVRRLHAQYSVARALAESSSLREAAGRILQAIGEALGGDYAGLWQVDAARGGLRCVETWSAPGTSFAEFEAVSRQSTLARGIGLPGRVWATGQPFFAPDIIHDPNFPRGPAVARVGLHSALGFPVLLGTELIGVLEFFSREIGRPDAELLEMLATVGSQIGQFAERKRAEADLATLFDTSPDLLCIAGVDGTFRRLNPAWEKTLGFTAAELMSRPYVDFVHPEDRPATSAEAGTVAGGTGSVLFENRYLCKDGSYRWLSWKSTPLPEQGLVYAVARDVTEQKRIAEELRLARAGAEQDELLHTIDPRQVRRHQAIERAGEEWSPGEVGILLGRIGAKAAAAACGGNQREKTCAIGHRAAFFTRAAARAAPRRAP